MATLNPKQTRMPWTDPEREFLRKHLSEMTEVEIAQKLNKTPKAVRRMRQRLGLGSCLRPPHPQAWTEQERRFILEHPDMDTGEMANALGRTQVSVNHARKKLGLTESNRWETWEDTFLKEHPDMKPTELARHVGHTAMAIRIRRLKLGLPTYIEKTEWFDNEIQILSNHLQSPMPELRQMLTRHNNNSIRSMARKLGRKRNNRKGYSILNGYRTILRDGKPFLEHRAVMEDMLGRPLGEDEIVHHIDCDRLNNDLENLVLLENHSSHRAVHKSLSDALPDLLQTGALRYDFKTHRYVEGQS